MLQGGTLVGLITERNDHRKGALHGRSSRETGVGEIITRHPPTVSLESTITPSMLLITEKRACHLPFLEHGRVVGMLSIGAVVQ